MGRIIAVANQKGGVGKTTTAINLSSCLAEKGKKVLAVDMDPQGNMTSGLGVDKNSVENTIYDLIIGESSIDEVLRKDIMKNLDIIPANIDLSAAEIELIDVEDKEYIVRNVIKDIKDNYDYIIIDCPPSLSMLTINAMTTATSVLVPIQCEYYALEGLSQLMSSVRRVKRQYNTSLEIEGVLLTMFDGRLNLTQQVVAEVKKFFPGKVFSSVIPRGVRLSEAPGFGLPVMYYDKSSKGALSYMSLAEEIIRKERNYG